MKKIWYLLKCPEKNEADYTEKCIRLMVLEELEKVVCFQYQRMMRYGGKWHLENRMLLPGYIFLSGTKTMVLGDICKDNKGMERNVSLVSCEIPYMAEMCQNGNLIGMSRGIIRHGNIMVISGPLEGREGLIRRIDRHKRTAEIEIPFAGNRKYVTVGLEIYEKQI